jgi:hypothetical protein
MPAAMKWDKQLRTYRDKAGKALTQEQVRDVVKEAVKHAQDRLTDLTQEMVNGNVSVRDWPERMRDELQTGHAAMLRLAFGGQSKTVQANILAEVLKLQWSYLDNFIEQVRAKSITAPQMVSRAGLYGSALYSTYENGVTVREAAAGMKYVQWVLDDGTLHCEGDGSCPQQVKRGRVLIKNSPPIGSRICRVNCRCYKRYFATKKGKEDQ